MEHTILALCISACITDLSADVGLFEFQSRYLSLCVGYLYTVVQMVLLEFGEQLVSRKGMLPLLSGGSTVNVMWVSIWFMWLFGISTWSFLTMQITSSTNLIHQGVGMGHRGHTANSSKYSIYILAITGETGEPRAASWSCL